MLRQALKRNVTYVVLRTSQLVSLCYICSVMTHKTKSDRSSQLHCNLITRKKQRRGLGRMSMTPEQYRLARELRGTQQQVASYLRVSRVTVARREAGKFAITHEATLALLTMPPVQAEQPPPHQQEFAA